jgi:hexosaminidase
MFRNSMISLAILASGMSHATQTPQQLVDRISEDLLIHYQVEANTSDVNNLPCQTLGADWALCNKSVMTLSNQGQAINNKDWSLYIHSVRIILSLDSEQFTIARLTGDLYELKPTAAFKGLEQGESLDIPVIGEYWQLFESDFMPRAFVNHEQAEPRVLKQMDTEDLSQFVKPIAPSLLKRVSTDNNTLMTPKTRFEQNQDLDQLDIASHIVPTPNQVRLSKGNLDISQGLDFTSLPLSNEALEAIEHRAVMLGLAGQGEQKVYGDIDPNALDSKLRVNGGYQLSVTDRGIAITAFDETGVYYAVQSIFSLVDIQKPTVLPLVDVADAPRYQYRGVMVDVARNFHSKSAIFQTLDQMAAYKLNKLHLHLTDDEGWRLEIPGLPELTDIGAKRCFDKSETRCLLPQLGSGPTSDNFGSGFFSRQDYIDILQYAAARQIEVIPEIDMPAHARAAVVSMEARHRKYAKLGEMEKANEFRLLDPQDTSNVTTVQFYDRKSFLNPCLDSSHRFVKKVMAEILAMHEAAGVPLTTWHFGGDEAKNIKKLGGYQDVSSKAKVLGKGEIELSAEHHPFEKSPKCQALIANNTVDSVQALPSYFAKQVAKLAAELNVGAFQAWQDGLKTANSAAEFATKQTRVNFWDTLYWGGSTSAYQWANKGYQVIISSPDYLYMDFPYEFDPKERGYYWATRYNHSRKMFAFAPGNLPQNAETSFDRDGNGFSAKGSVEAAPFYGMSAQLWSETVRTDAQYEYMVFPRVIAAAERAWHKAEWELDYQATRAYSQESNYVDEAALTKDFNRFANALGQRELNKLAKANVHYRLPVPGAVIEQGKLYMNSAFPGVALQYSRDRGASWQSYEVNRVPSVSGEIWIRSVDYQAKRASRVTTLTSEN